MPDAPPENVVAVVSGGAAHALGRAVADALRTDRVTPVVGDARGADAIDWARAVAREHAAVARLVLLHPDAETNVAVIDALLPRLLAAGSDSYGGAARIVIAGRTSRFARTRTANLELVRALHTLLKDASWSRRIQVVGALGDDAIVAAATAPHLRGGQCVAPSGPAGRVGPARPGELPSWLGGSKRCLRRLDEACRASGASLALLRDEARRLEGQRQVLASGARRISALVRARNEEEFLYPAVKDRKSVV